MQLRLNALLDRVPEAPFAVHLPVRHSHDKPQTPEMLELNHQEPDVLNAPPVSNGRLKLLPDVLAKGIRGRRRHVERAGDEIALVGVRNDRLLDRVDRVTGFDRLGLVNSKELPLPLGVGYVTKRHQGTVFADAALRLLHGVVHQFLEHRDHGFLFVFGQLAESHVPCILLGEALPTILGRRGQRQEG